MPEHIKPQFYVYVLRDPRPGKDLQPIYVGKGKGDRAYHHWRHPNGRCNNALDNKLNKIREANLEPQVDLICYFENEADAFRYEEELVARYGRLDLKTGILCNRTNGGEGSSGHPTTEKARKTRSENIKKLHADPKFIEANLERLQRLNADPKIIKGKSDRMRALHADPKFAEEHVERSRTMMNKLNADPKIRKAAAERMRKIGSDPASAKRSKERWADPLYRARMSKAFSDAWIKRRLRKEKSLPPHHP